MLLIQEFKAKKILYCSQLVLKTIKLTRLIELSVNDVNFGFQIATGNSIKFPTLPKLSIGYIWEDKEMQTIMM